MLPTPELKNVCITTCIDNDVTTSYAVKLVHTNTLRALAVGFM